MSGHAVNFPAARTTLDRLQAYPAHFGAKVIHFGWAAFYCSDAEDYEELSPNKDHRQDTLKLAVADPIWGKELQAQAEHAYRDSQGYPEEQSLLRQLLVELAEVNIQCEALSHLSHLISAHQLAERHSTV